MSSTGRSQTLTTLYLKLVVEEAIREPMLKQTGHLRAVRLLAKQHDHALNRKIVPIMSEYVVPLGFQGQVWI